MFQFSVMCIDTTLVLYQKSSLKRQPARLAKNHAATLTKQNVPDLEHFFSVARMQIANAPDLEYIRSLN